MIEEKSGIDIPELRKPAWTILDCAVRYARLSNNKEI
jgi:hypothetical protein